MRTRFYLQGYQRRWWWLGHILLLITLLVSTSCGTKRATSVPKVSSRSYALSSPIAGKTLHILNGTYTGCLDRTGSWSVAVGDYEGSLPNPSLSVISGDTYCQLSLTSVVFDTTTYETTQPEGLPMLAAYSAEATPFVHEGDSGADFFGNIRMFPTNFSEATFQIDFIYSNLQTTLPTGSPSSYILGVNIYVSTNFGGYPQYDYDSTYLTLRYDIALDKSITFTSGYVRFFLYPSGQSGELYVLADSILGGGDPSNLSDVDTTFNTLSPNSIYGTYDFYHYGYSFNLNGYSLSTPLTRYLIVKHQGSSSELISYQVFEFIFSAP